MRDRLQKWRDGLARTRQAIVGRLSGLVGVPDEDSWDALEETLLAADLGVDLTVRVVEELKSRARREGLRGIDQILAGVRDELRGLMLSGSRDLALQARPSVITVVGVNGVGKTTTIGKMAHRFTRDGHKTLIVAADTFRAAATDQLGEWARRAGADIVTQGPGADPAAVAFDGLRAALARGHKVVIVDTAGRLHTRRNLMEELKKIHRVLDREMAGAPHEILLVLDATTGQNALPQAQLFGEAVGVTGLVLAKMDGTAKGGMALAVESGLKIPVKMVGLGEGLMDLEPFDPDSFINAMFD